MKQITTDTYGIEVPIEAYNFDIGFDFEAGTVSLVYQFQKTGNKFEDMCRKSTELDVKDWVPHSLKLLGTVTASEIDFDVSEYVECYPIEIADVVVEGYMDYEYPMSTYTDAQSSYRSLLASKGFNLTERNKVLIVKKS